jgi:3-dehydroquinate synthase
MRTVTVNIAERPYKILIDQHLLMGVGGELSRFAKPGTKVAVFSSKTVNKLYSERVIRSLKTSGYDVDIFLLPSGEANKNLATVSTMYDELIENEFDRASFIIALGGGIVGDVSGFIASSLYRGLPFIQIPTTLLSQVDSSVGGKVGVNHAAGKNLIGAFYQPKTVLIDPTVLKTLDRRELICGYGEILKYGFIKDADFLDLCLENKAAILDLKDLELVADIIERSVEIKAEIVAKDETESGHRMLLNFGHTVGHAIEKSCGFGHFLHGEAVILGMCAALKLSQMLTGLDEIVANKMIDDLLSIDLGGDLKNMDIDLALNAIKRDKKVRNGKINFVLLEDIGSPVIVSDVNDEMIKSGLIWLKDRKA